jgi:hypothetical protein
MGGSFFMARHAGRRREDLDQRELIDLAEVDALDIVDDELPENCARDGVPVAALLRQPRRCAAAGADQPLLDPLREGLGVDAEDLRTRLADSASL